LALLLGDNDGDDNNGDGALDDEVFAAAVVAAVFGLVVDDVLDGRSDVEADFRNERSDDIANENKIRTSNGRNINVVEIT